MKINIGNITYNGITYNWFYLEKKIKNMDIMTHLLM
jgi:hypothetical protein